ncbi:MAG: type VI secretion protein ImpB [Planctomycetota bacterium]
MTARWLFIDMNGFFAAAEQHDHRALRGRPVGVTPTEGEASGIIAASVEAKAAGVRMGMRPREARHACPDIAVLKARPDRYVELHKQLLDTTAKHAPVHKAYSIDEWAVRLISDESEPAAAAALAERIRRQIVDDLSPALRCSIGIAPSRLLAKIASDVRKPDGLTVLAPHNLPDAIEHLALDDLTGISTGILNRLHRHGVTTVRQLWELDAHQSRRIWGSVQGEHWWHGFHGHDLPEQPTRTRGVGHAHVLPPKLRNDEQVFAILVRLLCKAAARARLIDHWAHGLRVTVRYQQGPVWHDHAEFPATRDTPTLLHHLRDLWQRRPSRLRQADDTPRRPRRHAVGFTNPPAAYAPAVGPPKQVAIDLAGLTDNRNTPGPLFPDMHRPLRLTEAMDQINQRFGSHRVYFGSMHPVVDYLMEDKIAFGRVPNEQVKM